MRKINARVLAVGVALLAACSRNEPQSLELNSDGPREIVFAQALNAQASPTLQTLAFSPSSVVGGQSSTATLTLSSAAPAGGAVIALSSSKSAVAAVPASVTIPEGATSGTFTVTTSAQPWNTGAFISAAYNGLTTTESLTVTLTLGVRSLSLSRSVLQGGGTLRGTVDLNTTAPTGGLTVTLSSDSAVATVPSSVTIAAGRSWGDFTIATSAVTSQIAVTISATGGATTQTTTLRVVPSPTPSDLSLSRYSVVGGGSSIATVTLTAPAPAGGSVVTLSSSNTSAASVPTTLIIPERASSGTFTITTYPQSSSELVSISAMLNGLSATADLDVTILPILDAVSASTSTIQGGKTATGTVHLTGNAPEAGATVPLWSSSSVVSVPASVLVPAGHASASFVISSTAVSSPTTVNISSIYPAGVIHGVALTVVPSPTPSALTLSPSTVAGGEVTTATIVLTEAAPATGAVVTLSSSDTSGATVPSTLTIPAGSSTGTFAVNTFVSSVAKAVTITATFNGLAATAGLTVSPIVVPGNALYDPTLMVPRCSTVGSTCDTGALIDGRASLGPEADAPNTVRGGCTDGTSGSYHHDESLDRLKVSTVDGGLLDVGKAVLIEATVWSYSPADNLDLYFAPDAENPVWTYITTLQATGSQKVEVLSTTFTLPDAILPTVRGQLRYQGSASSCSSGSFDDHDDVVFALAGPSNTAPVVNAGPDQSITLPATASLTGTATDDGLPNPPSALATTWSVVSAPGTVTFANASAASTTATFSTAGTYTLRLSASDTVLSSSDDVVINVKAAPINAAPVVNAGVDQTITLPAMASLVGSATDDGRPNPPAALTVTWSAVSGPGTVTFASSHAINTTASFSTAGTYTLRLTASDSALSTADDVVVTVKAPSSSPCAGLCSNPVVFTIRGSFQSGSLGTSAVCYETTSNIAGGNCGNLASPRSLSVNGIVQSCAGNWSKVPAKRNGGYCIQTTAGNYPWAYFTAW